MENSRLRTHAFAAVAAAMLCAASGHVAGAQIYKCTNAQGKVQYQQHPCDESAVQSAVQGKALPSATVPPPASLDATGRGYFDFALRKATCDHGVPGFASRTEDDFTRWKSENAALARRVESDPEYARRLGEVQRRDAGSSDALAKADCNGLLNELALASANKSPDRRYASPRITWATFLSAMRVGRLDAALDSLAEPARSAFGMSNRNASPESLRSFAGAFQAFHEAGGEGVFREATAMRNDGGSEILLFRKVGGDWKIADMQASAARGTPR